jgi:hypothetical protein
VAERGRQLRIVWLAMCVGVATYTVVIFALVSAGTLALGVLDKSIVNVVASGVIVYMAAGLAVRRAMIARIPAGADPQARLAKYWTATIVALALMESGGLIVITLGMLASSPTWILAGGGAALGMMLLARPGQSEIGH